MSAAHATATSTYRLIVGDLDDVAIQVVRAPQLSVLHWLIEAASSDRLRHPVAQTLSRTISDEGRRIFPAIGMHRLDRLPGALTHPIAQGITSVEAYVQFLAECEPALFADEVLELWGGRPPRPWRSAAEQPARWLASAIEAVNEAWLVGRSHWETSELMFRHEEAKIGACAVTGTLGSFLNRIDPRLHATDDAIVFASHCNRQIPLGDRRLALVPMLVPSSQALIEFEGDNLAYIGYPLGGAAQPVSIGQSGEASNGDKLVELLGPVRASALRTLEHPQSMSELANLLRVAPSTLTYHCDQLSKAGLVRRERHGRGVWVLRTTRALRLIELMS